ncbi:hypothetical protein [Ensifer aridi]|uniref:hypothetical protein n=1 Tax=Ensifer aridi TaxID=1708715 RepID=UPI00047B74E2|nr:hypothetical protein [Ensifer aridi]
MRHALIDLAKAIPSNKDRFIPDLQDRLIVRRGHPDFIVGKISLVESARAWQRDGLCFLC